MSDSSQGEGWWIASDGKWYAPELHPNYVEPTDADLPIVPDGPDSSNEPNFLSQTVVLPAEGLTPVTPVQSEAPPTVVSAVDSGPAAAGPTFVPAGDPTQVYQPEAPSGLPSTAAVAAHGQNIGTDPAYNLPETDQSGGRRNLILGIGAAILLAAIVFLAFRFFTGSSAAGGASSPEEAVDQLVASINERDAVGFVDVFDPDEIEAWFGSFAPAVARLQSLDDSAQTDAEVNEAFQALFDSFDYSVTGPDGEPISYDVQPLDDDNRITRVRINGLDVTIDARTDQALIAGFGETPSALDLSFFDEPISLEIRDRGNELEFTATVPGEGTETESAPDAHLDLVTVQKDGKWFVSIGYSFLEIAREQGAFDGLPNPDFGEAFRLVEEQTGGAETPEGVVEGYFDALETLDYERMIDLTDPYGTPYLRDYRPLIDAEVDQGDRQQAVADANLRISELDLGQTEWEGRTVVTLGTITMTSSEGEITLDTTNWCASIIGENENDRACLEDGINDLLREIDSSVDARDLIPETTGFVVVERNGRWYFDALGTMGFLADTLSEAGSELVDEFDTNPLTDASTFFVAPGPIAREGQPAVTTAADGSAGVAVDLSRYPEVIGRQGDSARVAVARVVTTESATVLLENGVPLTGEDWIVVYDRDVDDVELPAIASSTTGDLDVELFEPQIIQVGADGFTGQFGGQGRPQILVLGADTVDAEINVTGAEVETIRWWQGSEGISVKGASQVPFVDADERFVVLHGEPGATFQITVNG